MDYLKSVLDEADDNPIPLDQFYLKFCERFPHCVRQEVATNPKELLQFLKLNRAVFFIRSNKALFLTGFLKGIAQTRLTSLLYFYES